MTVSDCVRADVAADLEEYGATGARRVGLIIWRVLFVSRLQAVLLLRLAQTLSGRSEPAAVAVKWLSGVLTGSDISWRATVGPGLRLYHPVGVVVGNDVVVGARCTLMQGVTLGHDRGGSPRLGDDVMIGPGAVILGPIEIGDGARVGANAVVTHSLPAGAVAYGNPARIRE